MRYVAHPVLAAEDSKENDKYAYVVYAQDAKFDDPNVKLFWCEDGSAEVMSKKDADHFTYEEALKLEKMKGKHTWKMERVPHYGTNVSSSERIDASGYVEDDEDAVRHEIEVFLTDFIRNHGGDLVTAWESSDYSDIIDSIVYLLEASRPYVEEVVEDDVLEEI